jgi:hypothetical protein
MAKITGSAGLAPPLIEKTACLHPRHRTRVFSRAGPFEPRLLDAAHIVMDADEQLEQPIVSNGSPLTKIHHAALSPRTSRRENKKRLFKMKSMIYQSTLSKLLSNLLAITANNTT